MNPFIAPVPCHLVTGFLGAGKTTLIGDLLRHKPETERWAVLVNEFGEIGLDAALLSADELSQPGIVIREVAGGCLCCAAGVPLVAAVNQLLAKARPDRLLIEPTGLGHPRQILRSLQTGPLSNVLLPRATLTVVDARKARDQRYAQHDTFRQQLSVADLIIASKCDLYAPDDLEPLSDLLQELELDHLPVIPRRQGEVDLHWLKGQTSRLVRAPSMVTGNPQLHSPANAPAAVSDTLQRSQKQDDGYYSCGWMMPAGSVFDHRAIVSLLLGLECERIKAVLDTGSAGLGLNLMEGVLGERDLPRPERTRFEFIHHAPLDCEALEQKILACVQTTDSTA